MISLFSKIGILGKPGDPKVEDAVRLLAEHLLGHRLEVIMELRDTPTAPPQDAEEDVYALPGWGADCQLVIVVGGDGTLLRAARVLAESSIPLLGISLGRLGFLVDISPGKMLETIDRVLGGEFDEERRFLLMARSGRSPELGTSALALNDVVLHKWNTSRMIEFETYIDGQFVNAQRADGLIVSTPTGSTAYALSGGGPLLHPQLNALELVPICPHTLSNRPIVIDGDSRVEIHLRGQDHDLVRISCDGQTHLPMGEGEKLYIRKHHHPVRLLHPKGHDYYRVLRAKLGWGSHVQT